MKALSDLHSLVEVQFDEGHTTSSLIREFTNIAKNWSEDSNALHMKWQEHIFFDTVDIKCIKDFYAKKDRQTNDKCEL